jgi:hypothetical protein
MHCLTRGRILGRFPPCFPPFPEEINNEVLIIKNKTDTSKNSLLYLGLGSIKQPANP